MTSQEIMKADLATSPVVQSDALTPMQMINSALERGASLDMVQHLMALSERWEDNQARKAFDEAISAAKAEIQPILKNREVDFTSTKGRTNYRHEDLAQIARQVDPILSKFGLSYRFRTSNALNEPVRVTCIISHRLGHSEENTLSGPRDESGNKNSLQAVGSAITYLQRYTLKAALGLAVAGDDDGRSGGSGPAITDEQVAEMRMALEAAGADVVAFCRWAKIDALADMRADKFAEAMSAIRAKGAQRK